MLTSIGYAIDEADFFAGDLRGADNEAVYVSARRLAASLAFEAADRLLAEHAALREANERGGRGTVRLFIARRLCLDIEPVLVRALAARAIAGSAPCTVVLSVPATIDPDLLRQAFPDLRLLPSGGVPVLDRWTLMARAVVSSLGRELRWMLPWTRSVAAPARPTGRPGLLLIQEDELSLDRSHRSQPHWLPEGAPRLGFDVYVLALNRAAENDADHASLRSAGVELIDARELIATRRRSTGPVDDGLAAEARRVGRAAVFARTRSAIALAAVWGLLVKARSLAAWCAHLNVRGYLTGENYPVWADAMQIVAHRTGVATASFQYSNLAFSTPLMMTTADRLVLFSKTYAPLWTAHGVAPRLVEEAGYVFDGAFRLVAGRAAELRAALLKAGATFVFCYFDESIQTDKFGLISEAHHHEELRQLAQALLADPAVGLVVKSQFGRNSPSRRYAADPVLARARETGRYVELRHGRHRNTVFPAEAALAADFAIGHVVGATAGLEAALAGRRCALLNPYGMRSVNDALYARAAIVVRSMPELLHAVARMRAGDPEFAAFGDWRPILPQLDPWRDGQAAARLRATIEDMLGTAALARPGAA